MSCNVPFVNSIGRLLLGKVTLQMVQRFCDYLFVFGNKTPQTKFLLEQARSQVLRIGGKKTF